MGLESSCTAHFKGNSSRGKLLLESDSLLFRGDFRLKIPIVSMRRVRADSRALRITFPDGTVSFDLGPSAARWADKILHPPSLLDKLGVKPSMNISLLGRFDKTFLADLRSRTSRISTAKPVPNSDLIFLLAESKSALARFKTLRASLQPAGALWVVYPKGQPHITEAAVMAAAKSAGLVDVKVCRFSSSHTALKLVIPVSKRNSIHAPSS